MVRALLVVVGLALAVALGLWSSATPSPVPASAPTTSFSSERALTHLRVIAAKPHRVGTAADAYVEKYLVDQLKGFGFDVRVQAAVQVEPKYTPRSWPVIAASVRNVVARRRGTSSGPCPPCDPPKIPSLLLSAHYDSRELAPGAGDDGFGVAALLETARALAASPPLLHDVVILLTEGEEEGLLGARAFVAKDPDAKDMGLVLNFDARGDAGPVTMFQTSPHAADLIDVLARSAPHVNATSLAAEIYRRLPNDTDLTAWLDTGHAGMNFANAEGFERYHQATDSVANADPGTLQQHGSYALSLARAFGSRDTMVRPTGSEQIYFDVGPLFMHYRAGIALPLAVGALVLLATVVVLGIRRGRFRARGVLVGAAASLVVPIVALVVGWLVGQLATHVHGGALARQVARADLKNALFDGCLLLGAAAAWTIWSRLARRFGPANVGVGATLPWAIIAIVLAVLFAGGSYLLAWPVVFASIAWSLETRRGVELAHVVAAGAAIVLLVPLGPELGVTFGSPAAPAIALMPAIAASFAIVPMTMVEDAKTRVTALVLTAAGAVAVAWACLASPFDAHYPQPDTLIYALDADHDAPSWISTDDALDAWTSRALGVAETAPASSFFARSGPTETLWRSHAPPAPCEKPRVDVLASNQPGQLHVRVVVPPATELVDVVVPPEAKVTSATVAGVPVGMLPSGAFELYFSGPPPEGFELTFTTAAPGPVPMRVVAQSRGFPPALAEGVEARPADRMPRNNGDPLQASDMTIVASSFHL